MRVWTKSLATAAAVAMFGVFSAASAATVTITDITASWINTVGGTNLTTVGNGTDNPVVTWGVDAGSGQSGYGFEAVDNVSVPVPPDQEFELGTFTHFNNPISAGTSITGTTLQVNMNVSIDGGPAQALAFFFDFDHFETPNAADPCANGEPNGVGVNINGCADLVTVTNSVFSDTFEVDGVLYTIAILGFKVGTDILSTFATVEGADSSAILLAKVSSEIAEIPLPAAMPLFLAGLAGFGFATRRKRKLAQA